MELEEEEKVSGSLAQLENRSGKDIY